MLVGADEACLAGAGDDLADDPGRQLPVGEQPKRSEEHASESVM